MGSVQVRNLATLAAHLPCLPMAMARSCLFKKPLYHSESDNKRECHRKLFGGQNSLKSGRS
jgi:hypothetical protein